MNTHRLERYSGNDRDTRKTYDEYRKGIVIGGTTTMSNTKQKRARAKRRK